MKKLLLLTLLIPGLLWSQNKQFYAEKNIGLTLDYEDSAGIMASALFGTYIEMGDYSLIDVQVGLSYPYIVTGKIGVGSYYGKREQISFIVGCRPYPLTAYAQLNFKPKTGMHFILSGELGTGGDASVNQRSLINAGLRFPIKAKG